MRWTPQPSILARHGRTTDRWKWVPVVLLHLENTVEVNPLTLGWWNIHNNSESSSVCNETLWWKLCAQFYWWLSEKYKAILLSILLCSWRYIIVKMDFQVTKKFWWPYLTSCNGDNNNYICKYWIFYWWQWHIRYMFKSYIAGRNEYIWYVDFIHNVFYISNVTLK